MLLSLKYLSEREPREEMVRSNIKYGKLSFFFPLCFLSVPSFLHHPHSPSHSWLPIVFSALHVKTSLSMLETLGVFMLCSDQHSVCLQTPSRPKLLGGSSVPLSLWDPRWTMSSSSYRLLKKLREKLCLHSLSSQNLGHAWNGIQLGNVLAWASLLGTPREADISLFSLVKSSSLFYVWCS